MMIEDFGSDSGFAEAAMECAGLVEIAYNISPTSYLNLCLRLVKFWDTLY